MKANGIFGFIFIPAEDITHSLPKTNLSHESQMSKKQLDSGLNNLVSTENARG